VGIKLTAEEREILLESVPFPDAALEEKIRAADVGAQEVHLTLPELSGLASCLSAQLKHTERDRRLGMKLNRIWQRIRHVEELFESE
jgi:NifB/MoaA-like Fe-S oxidoreductase